MLQNEFDEMELAAIAQELLANKQLNKALMDSLPYPAMLITKNRKIIIANKIAKEIGVGDASFCWDTFGKQDSISNEDKEYYKSNCSVPQNGIKCTFCKANEALISQTPINEKIPAGEITYDTYWIPLTNDVYLHYAIVL